MSTVTDTTPVSDPDRYGRLAYQLERFERLSAAVDDALGWYRLHCENPDLAGIYAYPSVVDGPAVMLQCQTADQFAAAARFLARHYGKADKHYDAHGYARVTAKDGDLTIEAWTHRETVCDLLEVGTETVVTMAVACIHCGVGIRKLSLTGGYGSEWTHHDADGLEYVRCGTTIDDDGNEVGGMPATPPDFTEPIVETRPVTEWRCHPILAEAVV